MELIYIVSNQSYRIIGTAGSFLGSPPIREYPDLPAVTGIINAAGRYETRLAALPRQGLHEGIFRRFGFGDSPLPSDDFGRGFSRSLLCFTTAVSGSSRSSGHYSRTEGHGARPRVAPPLPQQTTGIQPGY